MTDVPAAVLEDGRRVVARFLLPLSVHILVSLMDGVDRAWGPGCRMQQEGDWLTLIEPTPEQRAEAEADLARRARANADEEED